uniref:receptor protein-tyrosine kinase n=2 Tax=Cacopsylla melanoneura TaxID=428564 RepID=A0A8D9A9C4_9HEMI
MSTWIITLGLIYWITLFSPGHCQQLSENTPPILWLDRNWVVSELEPVGSIVARVNARDDQDDPLEFGLEPHAGFGSVGVSNRSLSFRIDNETGTVYTNESLVGRAGENLFIYVTVFDGKVTAKSEVYVNIVGQNDTKLTRGRRPPGGPGKFNFPLTGGFPQRPPPPIYQRPPQLDKVSKLTPLGVTPSITTSTTTVPITPSETTSLATTSTSKAVFKIPHETPPKSIHSKTTEAPKHIDYASDKPPHATAQPTVFSILVTVLPIVIFTTVFLVFSILICLFRKKIFKKKHLSKKDANLRKEAERNIMRDDHILMQQWHGPRAFNNRYEGWQENSMIQNTNILNDPILTAKSDDKWEVPRHHIKVFNILGEGCFGQVWKCEALNIDGREGPSIVAVKTLKENAGERERLDLLQELTVMKTLEPHPNVVRLLGCCTEKEPFFVIMEFVMFGKLQSFLRNSRAQRYYNNMHGKSNSLTSRDLTSFCYQVARGMQFLSSRGIIHRDLAARNVLIGENHCCKVADFGFARDLMTSSVYERKSEGRLPIRWMSPEALYDNIFSVKSDIWSFGVLIWEIVTLGSTPYPGMAAADVMKKVRDGYRLEKPDHCRRELYNIMYYCWDKEPNERPNFKELCDLLEKLILTETEYIELERFPDHSYYNMVSLSGEKL